MQAWITQVYGCQYRNSPPKEWLDDGGLSPSRPNWLFPIDLFDFYDLIWFDLIDVFNLIDFKLFPFHIWCNLEPYLRGPNYLYILLITFWLEFFFQQRGAYSKKSWVLLSFIFFFSPFSFPHAGSPTRIPVAVSHPIPSSPFMISLK